MPKLAFRVVVGGGDNFPNLMLKMPEGESPSHAPFRAVGAPYITTQEWMDEQGIENGFIEAITVTEFDDGRLVAYLTRRETISDEELAAKQAAEPHRQFGKVKVYVGEDPLSRTFIEHHEVTSIKLLLDQLVAPEEVSA